MIQAMIKVRLPASRMKEAMTIMGPLNSFVEEERKETRKKCGRTVISMKTDWKRIFPFDKQRVAPRGPRAGDGYGAVRDALTRAALSTSGRPKSKGKAIS